MKFQLPDGAFPPLNLTETERYELSLEAERVIDATISANEAFIARGKRLDPREWKQFRTKENMHVYRQRTPESTADENEGQFELPRKHSALSLLTSRRKWSTSSSKSSEPRSRNNSYDLNSSFVFNDAKSAPVLGDDPLQSPPVSEGTESSLDYWLENHKPGNVPTVVTIGTIDGTVEDAIFGVFSDDDASWKWKSTHISDRLDDARVLEQIHGPTAEDPLRTLGVKWFTKEHPQALTHIVRRRDFVILEAMGTRRDPNGGRIGYFMMHSVDIPRLPALDDHSILRAKMSLCFILRQANKNTVDVFARAFSDPQGSMMEGVSVRIFAESIVAVNKVVNFAYIKKLRWLMQHREQQRRRTASNARRFQAACKTCNKSLTKRLVSFLKPNSAVCQVCREAICSKCTVTKEITVGFNAQDEPEQRGLTFCVGCVLEAKRLPAFHVQELVYNLPPQPLEDMMPSRRISNNSSLSVSSSSSISRGRPHSTSGVPQPSKIIRLSSDPRKNVDNSMYAPTLYRSQSNDPPVSLYAPTMHRSQSNDPLVSRRKETQPRTHY
ncbi:hypothetical protein Poli38472_012617 [Pythium oligandrum]|uniref:FYVE-type domain-containing protein n=1 Tax=Pythium oligandrum TaxID=41045 RepID=A0A8K1FGA2_PYTOL|nr:hypothetical protein Poli38472_012617 [Pythium oligandrum]|eukprot:TMW61426.1 hypothetical protein Poli38472_012617 [Pythium oligandrum]